MIEYTQIKKIPKYYAKYKIAEFLLEDMPDGDVTGEGIFDSKQIITAVVQAQEELIFAGEQLYHYFFDDTFNCATYFHDGDRVKKDEIMAIISGPASMILGRERVLLNLLQRLCGIATLTREYVNIAKPYGVRILDTRKTTPGFRLFEKFAVTAGGGYNHRMDLSSGILIKDNHIKAAGSVSEAVNRIRKNQELQLPLELEVDTIPQLKEGLQAGVDGFLLDNMTPDQVLEATQVVRLFPGGKDIFIEASGGITLKTLPEYVKTGINAISVGALTHSVKGAEIHMEFLDK